MSNQSLAEHRRARWRRNQFMGERFGLTTLARQPATPLDGGPATGRPGAGATPPTPRCPHRTRRLDPLGSGSPRTQTPCSRSKTSGPPRLATRRLSRRSRTDVPVGHSPRTIQTPPPPHIVAEGHDCKGKQPEHRTEPAVTDLGVQLAEDFGQPEPEPSLNCGNLGQCRRWLDRQPLTRMVARPTRGDPRTNPVQQRVHPYTSWARTTRAELLTPPLTGSERITTSTLNDNDRPTK